MFLLSVHRFSINIIIIIIIIFSIIIIIFSIIIIIFSIIIIYFLLSSPIAAMLDLRPYYTPNNSSKYCTHFCLTAFLSINMTSSLSFYFKVHPFFSFYLIPRHFLFISEHDSIHYQTNLLLLSLLPLT